MSDEVDLPSWVIRRYVVVNDKKVDRFETLQGASAHYRKFGGEVRVELTRFGGYLIT